MNTRDESKYPTVNVRVPLNIKKRLKRLRKSYRSEASIVKECVEKWLPTIEARENPESFQHADPQQGGLVSAA